MRHLRSWLVAIACLGALVVGAPAARAAGAGTVELRIQTASNVAGGALLGIALPAGFVYNTDSKAWNLNLSAGAGYFLSPMFAIGADLGLTLLHDDETLTLVTIAPYVKIVTGLAEHETGFFAEPSIGFTIVSSSAGGDSQTLLQLGGWFGAHIFVGQSSALLIGPTVTYLRLLSSSSGDKDNFLIGVRFGLSTYLP